MQDPRLAKLANVLVNYSTRLQPGEKVGILGPMAAEPLMVEIYRYALRAGALPELVFRSDRAAEILLREGNDEQVQFVSPTTVELLKVFDCTIGVMGETNTKTMTTVDPARMSMLSKANKPVNDMNMRRLGDPDDPYRWVGTLFPTQGYAQDARMSLDEYADFVFAACLPTVDQLPEDAKAFVDPADDPADPVTYWRAFTRWQGEVARYVNSKKQLHVVGPNIDLRLSVAGRTWWSADGHVNFPDGEVFTGPVEDSVEGWVSFTYPAVFRGHEVRGVRLRFESGRVVEASAESSEAFLLEMLNLDEGSRRLGEFAIGTNPSIDRFTGNTLFDEKIKGTCHMALGKSIPGTGGVNESGLHWDMVCDLRQDSRIYADGELFYENGEFAVRFAELAGDAASDGGPYSMGAMFRRREPQPD
ncbi:MAG: aminopeptidase [Anaerolineae bacterium]|nr:aminopeptidase [Anaerolineae bacterium]MCO5243306.1 aminopeptidase [Anaerolineae bacterium]